MIGAKPRKGLCPFWERVLHPSAALIVWVSAVVGVQYLGSHGLLAMALVALFFSRSMFRRWWGYVRRARWLLLTLWLVLAYNTPGEALLDLPWAPTYEGVADAGLQAVRLLLILGFLAWLFERIGRDGLVSGLWGLLRPFGALGVDSERLVVRLSLVLDNLQSPPEKGAWKAMLDTMPNEGEGVEMVHLMLPIWARRDTLMVGLAILGFLAAVWL